MISTHEISQSINLLRQHGVKQVALRGARRAIAAAHSRLNLAELDFPLRPADVIDMSDYDYMHPEPAGNRPLKIGWVCIPPKVGSGGHTTFFRMVQAVQDSGHECVIVLYDRDSDDVDRHLKALRTGWPRVTVQVASAAQIDESFDALVASSWPTAHVIAARAPKNVRRFYFVQDYEPYFYPRGYLYQLAEDSYQLGFHTIALGDMVASELEAAAGLTPDEVVPFGCDSTTYFLKNAGEEAPPRSGIVYYARKDNDRRGYLLAKSALEHFHEMRPDQEIHLYGDTVSGWKIPVTNHGNLSPAELNDLYNRTIASLAMSFTNISLVASELLAAGNVPVLNESATARQDASHAVWAAPAPAALAEALRALVEAPDLQEQARRAASKVPEPWGRTAAMTLTAIESSTMVQPGIGLQRQEAAK